MNNDIWSVREEPLVVGLKMGLKTFPGHRVPSVRQTMYFINSRLGRAWQIKVTLRNPELLGFWVIVKTEVRYKDAALKEVSV